jgi:hypothetical protein
MVAITHLDDERGVQRRFRFLPDQKIPIDTP